jgi:hypothetical protein
MYYYAYFAQLGQGVYACKWCKLCIICDTGITPGSQILIISARTSESIKNQQKYHNVILSPPIVCKAAFVVIPCII